MQKRDMKHELYCTFSLCLSLLLSIVACQNENFNISEQTQPLRFYTAIQEGNTTKASINVEGERIGVYGSKLNQYGQEISVFQNQLVMYENGAWGYLPEKYWDAESSYQFLAYFPYRIQGVAYGTDKTLSISDFSIDEQIDLMVSTPEFRAKGEQSPVQFDLVHTLCNVNLRLRKGQGWGSDDLVLERVVLKGMCDTGNLTHTALKSQWDVRGKVADDRFVNATAYTLQPSGQLVMQQLLMLPQAITPFIRFELTYRYGSEQYTKEVVLSDLGANVPWASNKQITYDATLSTDVITFAHPVVEAWGNTIFNDQDIIL